MIYFCSICDNMMHVRLVGDDEKVDGGGDWELNYHCPHCGDTLKVDNGSAAGPSGPSAHAAGPSANEVGPAGTSGSGIKLVDNLVYSRDYNRNTSEHNVINEYVKYDPTLPTTDIIPCPNVDCDSNLEDSNPNHKPRNIVYIRSNKSALQYVYICCLCNTTWRSANFVS